jgi:hypothetical protein
MNAQRRHIRLFCARDESNLRHIHFCRPSPGNVGLTLLRHPAIGERLVETMNKLIKYFVEATGYRRIFLLATLAAISALLTQFAGLDPWKILRVTWLHEDLSAPILPGIYFGTVLAVGACAWKRNSLFAAGVLLVATTIAWIVAWECAYQTFAYLDQLRATDTSLLRGRSPIAFFIIAGVVGGFVGGALTLVGISVATPDFRTINNWSRTLLVASLAGLLFVSDKDWWALFIVWQVCVAASIAFGWSFQESLNVTPQSRVKSS